MCQRVFNWFSWLQFLIVLIDASNEVTSSWRKDNGVASTKDLRSCVWAISVTRQTALSPLSVVRRRAQGTNARAVIKFVSRAKRSALFDLPTAQRCVCVMRWAAKEFVCAARWWMVVAGGRWAYCILISAFSKRIVYPHGCLLYLSANMNKWTNDSMINDSVIECRTQMNELWPLMTSLWRHYCLLSKVGGGRARRKSLKSETQFKNHYERTLSVKN